MSAPEHKLLPEGEWWACERPEADPEPYRQHYRPGCERCFPAWRVAAAQPRATFFTPTDPTLKALPPGYTEVEVRAWFMEGIVPAGYPIGASGDERVTRDDEAKNLPGSPFVPARSSRPPEAGPGTH